MANVANVKVLAGNQVQVSGAAAQLTGSGASVTVSSSQVIVTGTLSASGDVFIAGKLTAREYYTQIVTSSVIYESGSTKFGDTSDDTHEFTGSVNINGLVSSSVGFSGSAAGLTGLVKSVAAGNNISASAVDGNGVVTVALSESITSNLTNLTASNISASLLKASVLSASAAEFSGNVLIYGTASLSSNPDAAYVRYTGLPEDKILIYPGLKVSGSAVVSGNLDVTGSVSASSFTGSGAGLTNLPAANLTGIVPLANGGTGLNIPSASITDGLLLIGNDSTNSFQTGSIQVQGTGLHLTNSAGSITISSSLGQGITQVISSDPNLVITSGSGPTVTASLSPNPTFGNLTVTSSLNVSASLQRTRRTVTGSVSVAATDQAIFVNPAAATVITLPSPTALDGRELIVKRVDDPLTAFTVDVSGATIDDSGSFGLNGPMQSITLIADSGSNKWFVV
jgi:hypothetical protein